MLGLDDRGNRCYPGHHQGEVNMHTELSRKLEALDAEKKRIKDAKKPKPAPKPPSKLKTAAKWAGAAGATLSALAAVAAAAARFLGMF